MTYSDFSSCVVNKKLCHQSEKMRNLDSVQIFVAKNVLYQWVLGKRNEDKYFLNTHLNKFIKVRPNVKGFSHPLKTDRRQTISNRAQSSIIRSFLTTSSHFRKDDVLTGCHHQRRHDIYRDHCANYQLFL